MHRVGNLYSKICTESVLIAAFFEARRGKRNHRACYEFEKNLGGNIETLRQELISDTYCPRPCKKFHTMDGRKRRLIEAPAFRDLVVQHAVYNITFEIFERRYIDTSFACRKGLGVHKAADWMQNALRNAPSTSWVLHVDVRKFFYSIDRTVLKNALRRIIKCEKMLHILEQFAFRSDKTGIPIGNLMRQTFANFYLSALDHYCKRDLRILHYARYMDDSVMVCDSYTDGKRMLDGIRETMRGLGLEISHYTLQPAKRGVDFVGFKTWSNRRFVRPYVITQFRVDAKRKRLNTIISRLGHASKTASLAPLLIFLRNNHNDIFSRLPKSYR